MYEKCSLDVVKLNFSKAHFMEALNIRANDEYTDIPHQEFIVSTYYWNK